MRVNSLKISGVGGIKELKLDFHSGFNVICGANGIGKTTILNIIADSFVAQHSALKRNASYEQAIPLTMDAEGNIAKKDLNLGEYGLQGWTIEEIMQDVMEMPATTSTLRDKIIRAFDKAMDDEDPEEILKNYDILQQMLHPNSTLKKLLEIQIAGWRE